MFFVDNMNETNSVWTPSLSGGTIRGIFSCAAILVIVMLAVAIWCVKYTNKYII